MVGPQNQLWEQKIDTLYFEKDDKTVGQSNGRPPEPTVGTKDRQVILMLHVPVEAVAEVSKLVNFSTNILKS